jgi:hypothetical protein
VLGLSAVHNPDSRMIGKQEVSILGKQEVSILGEQKA